MLWKHYALIASAMVLVGGCSLDERRLVTAVAPNGPNGIGFAGPDAGARAQLELDPTALNFGRVTMGFQARERLTLRNSGSAPLDVPSFGWSVADPDFGLLQNPCLIELLPDESCELRVSLLPSRTGALGASLGVTSSASDIDVQMTGEGLAAGDLILAPAPGSFEDLGRVLLGSSAAGVFTLTNSGAAPTGVVAFSTSRPEFALVPPSGAPGECLPGTTSLAPGQGCNVRVAFNPAQRGLRETTFTAETFGTGSVSTRLTGEGRAPGALVAATDVLNFDGVVVGDGALRTLSLENDGDEALTLVGARLEPAGVVGFSIKTSDCAAGRVLDGGASCSVQVEFRPGVANQELTAELVADVAAAPAPLRVGLRGTGLESGRLQLGAAQDGGADFGAVLLDGNASRRFVVTNPTPQTSGVLSLAVGEGFAIALPGSPEACVAGSTSLGEGQSCTVEVVFEPRRREIYYGSLTIGSALIGAKSLPLTGRGIVDASIQVASELDFGGVFINAPSSRTLTVSNAGDLELPPPSFTLSGNSESAAAAFTYTSTCDRALVSGAQCEVTLSFAPTQPVLHSANLTVSASPGGDEPVLLLGEGLVPGSLVLAAADGGALGFGDVSIGAMTSKAFTLTNPGSIASGPLVFRTDDPHFAVSAGDCNQDPAGLAGGASCSFSVTFTPEDSSALTTNLSVQSTAAGLVGVELNGRGRRPATLEGTGNRDLGFANIGQPPLPENEFVWTLDNTGDLASGELVVENDNETEFVIVDDGCQGVAVPGGASCTLTIRFTPSTAGARTASVTVSDPTSDQAVPLALTGTGVQLAGLGESCLNADCAEGTCTAGVCCDRACDGTCQACVAGVCRDQVNEEPCGQGNGRCFGVDRCLLPDGLACGQGADCGSGNCEPRLGGPGPVDSLCCNGDCTATGLLCNAAGACEQPTAADGAVCGRPGDLPCADGLVCKGCADGASRCKAPSECCDACQAPLVCINGARCDCPPQPNGGASISCGGGLCIPSRLNACCPATPDCDANVPNCDPADNLCKECFLNSHCGPNEACNNGTCGCALGAVSCGNGQCLPAGSCCENCALTGRVCNNGTCGCAATQRQCPDGRCIGGNECCECGADRCVQGVCQAPAVFSANRASINFGNVVAGEAQADQSVVISNSGQQTSPQFVVQESENNAQFALLFSCPPVLTGGQSCTVTVTGFSALAAGNVNSAIVLRNPQNGQQLFSVPVQATATAPPPPATANIVTSFPEVIGGFDFGPTVVGTIQQVRWSVTNIGNGTSGFLDLSSSNDLQFSASASSCAPLAPGASCDVTVTYAPRADLTTDDPDDGDIGPHQSTFSVTGFPGSAYVFSGSGRPTFSAENP
jgi:hypothetical protein